MSQSLLLFCIDPPHFTLEPCPLIPQTFRLSNPAWVRAAPLKFLHLLNVAGALIELLKGRFMSNSQQLKCNKSCNYWIMDKTKGAKGNLHIKERTESRLLGRKSKISFFFFFYVVLVLSWGRFGLALRSTSQLHDGQFEHNTWKQFNMNQAPKKI